MTRHSFIWSLLAMVLAPLGLRRKPNPRPFPDYVRSHPPRWDEAATRKEVRRQLAWQEGFPLQYKFRGTTYEIQGPGKTVDVPADGRFHPIS